MTTVADEQLLTLAEVAGILGVAETTVARLIEHHGLPTTGDGYARKIRANDLESWVAAQKVPPGDLGHLT